MPRLLLPGLFLCHPACGGVSLAKTVHMDGLNANSGAVVPFVAPTEGVSGTFLTPAPLVQGIVLSAHGSAVAVWWSVPRNGGRDRMGSASGPPALPAGSNDKRKQLTASNRLVFGVS